MDNLFLEQVSNHFESEGNWTLTDFPLSVFDGPLDACPRATKTINLVEYMSENLGSRASRGDKIYLSDFNDCEASYRRDVLMPALNLVCEPLGFQVAAHGWEPDLGLRIECVRTRIFKHKKELNVDPTMKKRQTKTARPVDKSMKCPFHFTLKWDDEHKLWYIHEKNRGCMRHYAHCELEEGEVKLRTSVLKQKEKDLTKEMFDVNTDPATVRAILEKRTGHVFSSNQLQYLRVSSTNPSGIASNATPADKLLALLDANPTCSYVALFAEWDSGLVTVQKPRLRTVHRTPQGRQESVSNPDEPPMKNGEQTASGFAESVRKALQVSDREGQCLVGIVITTDEGRRLLAMFPEATASDVHMGLNAEKRPMIFLVGKSSENETFTASWGFLPSQSEWAFQWFWEVAHRTLHGDTTLSRNRANATDGDVHEFGPFKALCGEGGLYPNSSWRLCQQPPS
jgi:hypothetical protein